MDISGIRLAGLYSLGCPELKQHPSLNAESQVDAFVRSAPDSQPPSLIRSILEKLDPFLYFQLIALGTQESDFFSENVVRAHWIGNGLLRPVSREDIRRVVVSGKLKGCFDGHQLEAAVMKAFALVGIKPHHNACALQLVTPFRKGIFIPPEILKKVNGCLIKAGRVVLSDKKELLVESFYLAQKQNGDFCFNPFTEKVSHGFLRKTAEGDYVSFHLGAAREQVSELDVDTITGITEKALAFFQRER